MKFRDGWHLIAFVLGIGTADELRVDALSPSLVAAALSLELGRRP